MEWSTNNTVCISAAVFTLAVLYLLEKLYGHKKTYRPLPGPSLFEGFSTFFSGMKNSTLHLLLPKWASQYGSIMQVNLILRKAVLVNDANTFRRLVKDADLREFTNDRPPTFFGDYIIGDKDIALQPLGPALRQRRKIFHNILKFYGEGRGRFEQLMVSTLGELTSNLKKVETVDFPNCIRQYILSLIGFLLTGDISDEAKAKLNKITEFSDSSNKLFLFENETVLCAFPFLRFVPGFRFKNLTDTAKSSMESIYDSYFYEVKETYKSDYKRGMVDEMLDMQNELREEGSEFQLDDDTIKALMLDVVVAAYITTSSTLSGLFLYLIENPEIQTRIYQEITRVIGKSTPSFQHKQKMPFTDAVILETLRLTSVTPLLVPHLVKKDITFDGYLIPKSAILMMNGWYNHHRDDYWNDPFKFKPERFLDSNGQLLDSGHPTMQNLIPFGSGSRSCPGEIFGKSRMFLIVAFLLQTFQFLPSDRKGDALPPSDPRLWKGATILCPENYTCKLLLRKDTVADE